MQSKYNELVSPLSKIIISELQQKYISFDGYFARDVAYQIIEGLGPHNITKNGKRTTVREELAEFHSTVDEIKADVGSLWMLFYLLNQNKLHYDFLLKPELANDKFISKRDKIKRSASVTFVTSLFRKVRFGDADDIGRASTFVYNYFIRGGAIIIENEIIEETPSLRVSVDFGSFEFVVEKLFGDIMNIQAQGDKKAAEKLLDEYSAVNGHLKKILEIVEGKELPVDILPQFKN
jgi:predicted RNA-binding protein